MVRDFQPAALKTPQPLNLVEMLDPYLFLKTDFGLDITAELNPSEEAATNFTKRVIELSPGVWEHLCAGQNRARFTAAHEICHVFFHRKQLGELTMDAIDTSIRLYRDERVEPFRNPEWQANTGASFLLMPSPGFEELVTRLQAQRESRSSILKNISTTYRVSIDAARIRLSRFEKEGKRSCK